MRRGALVVILFTGVFCFAAVTGEAQVDSDATPKTKALYSNLKKIQNSNQFLFGQEFFNSFRYSSGSAHGEETYSDSKTITGSHPAVLGSDFHYYIEKSDTERGYHTNAVKWAYQQGYVITFDWHISARTKTSYECAGAPANLARNIANGNANGDRDWYLGELDKVIEIINEDLVAGNDTIPIVFRPLHEMNGGWFWWGACSGLTAAEYKLLYQLTADYVKARTKSVLFCWSPNTTFSSTYYPGDDYVDVIGVDAYEATLSSLRSEVGKVVDFAQEHNKIAVFSETGDRNSDATAPLYWKNVVLPGIIEDPSGKASKIAWVLTWINASWSEPYVAHSSSSATVKQSFIDFKNSANVIFGDEVEMPDMYTPSVTVSLEEGLNDSLTDLKIYPVPSDKAITIEMKNFRKPSTVCIYDTKGKLVHEIRTNNNETTLDIRDIVAPGIYLIRVTDRNKVASKKVRVE